jgi:hypothetical protein
MSGQLQAQPALPSRKELQVPTEREAEWTSLDSGERKICILCRYWESSLGLPARSLVITLTQLPRIMQILHKVLSAIWKLEKMEYNIKVENIAKMWTVLSLFRIKPCSVPRDKCSDGYKYSPALRNCNTALHATNTNRFTITMLFMDSPTRHFQPILTLNV